MEGVQRGAVDDGGLVPDEHALGVGEGVHDDGARVAEADLEDGGTELPPPGFADGGVVGAELEEVPGYGEGAGDFGDAFDVGDVR